LKNNFILLEEINKDHVNELGIKLGIIVRVSPIEKLRFLQGEKNQI
jgi:hypothetical protein